MADETQSTVERPSTDHLVQSSVVFRCVINEGLRLGTEPLLVGAFRWVGFLDVGDGSLGGVNGPIVVDDVVQAARFIESFKYGPELLLGHGN